MVTNQIDVYEGNDLIVIVTVTGISSLFGYEALFTVKEKKGDSTTIFDVVGVIVGLTITYTITGEQNSFNKGLYYYEVTIDNGTLDYTVVQDAYQMVESLVYHETT